MTSSTYLALEKDKTLEQVSSGTPAKYRLFELDLSKTSTPRIISSTSIELPSNKDDVARILDLKLSKFKKTLDEETFYISFSSTNFSSQCRYVNLIKIVLNTKKFAARNPEYIFRSPCFPPSSGIDTRLVQSGGRIQEGLSMNAESNKESGIYLSIGDFAKLADSGVKLTAQTKKYLSSIIFISHDGEITVLANGFRNPQGLALISTSTGTLLVESEHGPRGGDELNVIVKNGYYGWPKFSYGTRYLPVDPLASPSIENTAGNSIKPIYAWLPSIGIGVVHQISSITLRRFWADASSPKYGDLLIAGMANTTLNRLRIVEGQVIYSEPMFIGARIRSLVEESSGRIVLGTDEGVHILDLRGEWDTAKGVFLPTGFKPTKN